jgi:hypothetical protein
MEAHMVAVPTMVHILTTALVVPVLVEGQPVGVAIISSMAGAHMVLLAGNLVCIRAVNMVVVILTEQGLLHKRDRNRHM